VLKEYEILIFLKFGLFFSEKTRIFCTRKIAFSWVAIKTPFRFLFFFAFLAKSHTQKIKKIEIADQNHFIENSYFIRLGQ